MPRMTTSPRSAPSNAASFAPSWSTCTSLTVGAGPSNGSSTAYTVACGHIAHEQDRRTVWLDLCGLNNSGPGDSRDNETFSVMVAVTVISF